MNAFQLQLLSPVAAEEIQGVEHFTGRDSTGSFGLLAGAERRVLSLAFGLARFSGPEGTQYLALPGGLLYFTGDCLRIATTHYVRGADYGEVLSALDQRIRRQEESIREVRQSLKKLDEEILKRLTRMDWREGL